MCHRLECIKDAAKPHQVRTEIVLFFLHVLFPGILEEYFSDHDLET